MDMSTHQSFGSDSMPFIFDSQSNNYPFEMTNGGSTTPKRDQHHLSLSPFQQDTSNPSSTHLSLSQLRHLHEGEENTYLSCSNSPSPPSRGADGNAGVTTGSDSSASSGNSQPNEMGSAVEFLNNNSLGLLGNLNPPSPSSQSFSTSQESLMRPAMLHRQPSLSNLSDNSASSYYNDGNSIGSQHSQLDPTSPTRSSFTPSQSPMGITHSLSSISGLAIGTPQHQTFDSSNRDALSGQRGSPFQPRHHDQLLALSSGPVQIMAPPPGKRRATGVAHTLYTSQIRREEDGFDDTTPMPPSSQTFDGQQSHDVSNMTQQQQQSQQQSQSMMPMTPGRHSISGMPASYQTPHSTVSGTPDDSVHSSISSASSHRLRRMDSYDSAYSSFLSSPAGHGEADSIHGGHYPFQGRSLEEAIAEQEAKYEGYSSMTSNQNFDQLSSSAMSRVSSAPVPSMVSGGDGSDMSSQYSIPGTPNRGPPSFLQHMQHHQQQQQQQNQQHHHRKPSLPMTPNHAGTHPHQNYDLSLSAPQMMSSRSMQSPMGVVSPMSLMEPGTPDSNPHHYHHHHHHHQQHHLHQAEGDGIRSPSSGVSRTLTPRSRVRANVPPPLIVSSADKLHVCYCGKRFKRLEHLKRHNRVHTQERPHPCPAPGCNKWFGRTDNLTQHLKTHYRTVGRSSENLLSITNAKAAAAASMGTDANGRQSEARHDPHAAAAAAAAQAVNKTNAKARRSTVSNDVLGGPIALNRPTSTSPFSDEERHQFSKSPVVNVSLKSS